ncbi:tRNA pseudouridine(55) synthase TruB [Legionella oakridgensis]|uniref:tRNA pseudouridine(55) synthase TruB n=1 Tax=Legionella oakridgensis TaxID=29423 RepID=UPI0003DE19A1|nr:tRNA pseudouridine(55) synthase TruB [Legionella oakridgensis]ETO92322.1 tRNA pseudouridine synthase B [Legionella oakridgensis RV-2-2007]
MSRVIKLPINGILLANKPQGLSSNGVLQKIKHLYHARKAGHTGSLDPMATGMLPICFGEATKFCQYLLDADKCYEVTALLGIKTNTGDATGQVITCVDEFSVTENKLKQVLAQFTGSIQQIPSMFSALKHQGTPLYKLARAGIEIERCARTICIQQIQLNRFDGRQMDLIVYCSKGTYIRNLIEDIGEVLGVGAHVTRLHRLYTTGFNDEPMYTMDELLSKSPEERLSCLLPMERAVSYLPAMELFSDEVLALYQGKLVTHARINNQASCVQLYDHNKRFIGVGEIPEPGILKVKRLLSEVWQS